MGFNQSKVLKFFIKNKRFLDKILDKHLFYQEIYNKENKSNYNFGFESFTNVISSSSYKAYCILIKEEITLLKEVKIITKDEAETLKNMIIKSDDEDNNLIGVLLLKKNRKLLDKKLKDDTFESKFIINIVFDYFNKIYKPVMDDHIRSLKENYYD